MRRKDYILIASVIRAMEPSDVRGMTATQFADALGRENANFDRNKFLVAALGKQCAAAQKREYEAKQKAKLPHKVDTSLPLKAEDRTRLQRTTWRQTFKAMWARASDADKTWAREHFLRKG